MSLKRIYELPKFAVRYARNFNLFQSTPASADDHELRNQIISTRLFISLLLISLVILLAYTSTVKENKMITVKTPTVQRYMELFTSYAQTLTCPCTRIANKYGEFLEITYKLHQVCSSSFVTDAWIKYIHDAMSTKSWITEDLRVSGQYQFQSLKSLCELVNGTLVNSLIRFYATQYVSSDVTPANLFYSQARSYINRFQSATTKEFSLSLQIVRDVTRANKLFSLLQTNALIGFLSQSVWGSTYYRAYQNCHCSKNDSCTAPISVGALFGAQASLQVPGMHTGCYVLEALLQSDLRCFYNQSCWEQVVYQLNPNVTFHATVMNSSINHQFRFNSQVSEILDALMVDQWEWSVMYESYYNRCQPLQCSYTTQMRNNIVNIITILISLLGGLVTVLKLLVPRMVYFIRRQHASRLIASGQQNTTPFRIEQIRQLIKTVHYLNLFPSTPPSTEEKKLQQQRASTRLFITLLSISLIILLIYTSMVNITKTSTVTAPSYAEYIRLYNTHSRTLKCTCSHIAMSYESFFSIHYEVHPVCESDFVKDDWINIVLYHAWGTRTLSVMDFRVTGIPTFRALTSICTLVNNTIMNSLTRFYATQYVTAEVSPMVLFRSHMDSMMTYFRSSTVKEFLSSMQLAQEQMRANNLLSSGQTNGFTYRPQGQNYVSLDFRSYNNCSCAMSSRCSIASGLYNAAQTKVEFYVPGIYSGCYYTETLFMSNLQCFYNRSCIDELILNLINQTNYNITPIATAKNSRFLTNTTIAEMLDELLVDDWQWSADYERYFNTCQPSQCSYTEQTRNNAIYIITVLIGLVGGLVKALRLMVPYSVQYLVKIMALWKFRRHSNHRRSNHRLTLNNLSVHLRSLWRLNLFPSIPPATDSAEIHLQYRSSRFFIVLLFLSLIVLLVYTCTIPLIKTSTIQTPTLAQYERLYMKYGSTLTCPCSNVAIEQEKFIKINYTYHPICTSDFVKDQWINLNIQSWNRWVVRTLDFRYRGVFAFQALGSICELVDGTIKNSLTRFYTTRSISMSVIPFLLFQSEKNSLVDQFTNSTIREFSSSWRIASEHARMNGLSDVIQSNSFLYIFPGYSFAASIYAQYGSCRCSLTNMCIEPAKVYDGVSSDVLLTIPGLYTGCYVIGPLLKSDLRCFYNQTCIERYLQFIDMNSTRTFKAINASTSKRFLPTTTVEALLNELMIDQWQWSVDFSKYYDECQPTHCTYTETTRSDLIYIVTSLIGLTGGLVTTLKIIVPRAVLVGYALFRKKVKVVPVIYTIPQQQHHPRTNEMVIEDIH